jgi:hypothetical protein
MGPPSYMWSVVDRNVIMRRMTVMMRELVLLTEEEVAYWTMLDWTIDLGGLFSSECFMQIGRPVQRQQPFFLRVCSSQGKFVAAIWRHWNFITSLSRDAKLGVPGLPELPMMGSSFCHCRVPVILFVLTKLRWILLRYWPTLVVSKEVLRYSVNRSRNVEISCNTEILRYTEGHFDWLVLTLISRGDCDAAYANCWESFTLVCC